MGIFMHVENSLLNQTINSFLDYENQSLTIVQKECTF
jgi:hypothetical protein